MATTLKEKIEILKIKEQKLKQLISNLTPEERETLVRLIEDSY